MHENYYHNGMIERVVNLCGCGLCVIQYFCYVVTMKCWILEFYLMVMDEFN